MSWTTMALLSMLATAYGEADAGKKVFHDAGLGTRGVSCAHCHATEEDETTGDGLIRAGHTLFGVAKRGAWRGDTKRKKFATLSEAVDECVRLFMGTDGLEGADKITLAAYLKSISKKKKARPDLDTGLVPNNDYDRPEFNNGDADRGRPLFFAACHSCHPGAKAGIAPSLEKSSVALVAQKVREGNGLLRGSRKPGEWMPSFGRERLTDQQVADIAAYVQTTRP
ncbi:MAG: c-type cytochrome [Deltaproteobacteria bacterium]